MKFINFFVTFLTELLTFVFKSLGNVLKFPSLVAIASLALIGLIFYLVFTKIPKIKFRKRKRVQDTQEPEQLTPWKLIENGLPK